MKSSKPKGKTPSLIGGTLGTPRKCTVMRQCACKRCKTPIPKGVECYEIAQLGAPFTSYKRYCDLCFRSVLDKTKIDLEILLADTIPN